jgi:hypothetical protein
MVKLRQDSTFDIHASGLQYRTVMSESRSQTSVAASGYRRDAELRFVWAKDRHVVPVAPMEKLTAE